MKMRARVNPVVCFLMFIGFSCQKNLLAKSMEYVFDSALVNNVDVTRFNDGQQLPGKYLVAVFVNKKTNSQGDYKIDFQYRGDILTPNIKKDELLSFGIDPKKIKLSFYKGAEYIDFEKSDVKFYYSFFSKALVFYVPKQSLVNSNSELAPESQWDNGINALYLNYDTKLYHRRVIYDKKNNESYYVSLNPGINIGSWRLRNSGLWRKGYEGKSEYQNTYAYAERDLIELKSKLLLGESSTGSEIFDSIPFKGVRLSTSDNMIPYFERMFVPTIRGVADRVAQVDVYQHGYLIYSTEVPAGAFALSDIPAAEGADLEVTVTEDNGSIQHFTVPYNSPAISIKPGGVRYDLAFGKYRANYNTYRQDNFGHFTIIYGFNDLLTGYTGVQANNNYLSGAIGLGFNLDDLGAISLDGFYSKNGYNNNKTGSAIRIRYNKLLSDTDTSFNLASYQYTSENYSTLAESVDNIGNWKRKNNTSISIKQSFKDYGSVDFSLSKTIYWNQKDESSANFSYGTSIFKRASLVIGWNRVFNSYYRGQEDTFSASVSIPLGIGINSNSTNLRYQFVNERDGSVSNAINLNGLTYDHRLSWSISQGTNSKNSDNNRTAFNSSLRNSFGTISSMYNYSRQIAQYGGGINGGIVLHSQGVTFGQRINGATALVDANGAGNIPVSYKPGVSTDNNGFALVGGLSSYRKNDIYLSQSRINSNISIDKAISSVVPTDNAIVRATFATTKGHKAIFKILDRDGLPIKFGAVVSMPKKESVGIVGDDGKVYITGLDNRGTLGVQWGKHSIDRCQVFYDLKNKNSFGLYSETLKCM
jgi:outer membrane usher protein